MPYQSSSYKLRQIQKKKQKRRRIFALIAFIIVICGLGWVLFFSSVFQIKSIAITPTHFISINDIFQKVQERLNNQKLFKFISVPANLILFGKDDCQIIKNSFAALDSVDCQKNYIAHSVKINVKEKEAVGLFCPSSLSKEYKKCLYVDQSGIVFAFAEDDFKANNSIVLIKDPTDRLYNPGDRIISGEFSLVLKIKDILASHHLQLESIEIDDRDINYFSENGFKLFVSQEKLKETVSVLPQLIKTDFDLQQLEYLDLRFLPKVYYK